MKYREVLVEDVWLKLFVYLKTQKVTNFYTGGSLYLLEIFLLPGKEVGVFKKINVKLIAVNKEYFPRVFMVKKGVKMMYY